MKGPGATSTRTQGYLRFGFIDVYSGGRTYANNDGVIKTGWITVNGKQYYVKPDTRLFGHGNTDDW